MSLTVIASMLLPTIPSDAEDARRIVRHGLRDVLAWLGEEPGPAPGEKTHAIFSAPDLLFASPELCAVLREVAA